MTYRIIYFLLFVASFSQAQTTKNIEECEKAFLENNLAIAASKFNLNMADAATLQAKIWPLPEFLFSANAYNPDGNTRLMNIGKSKDASIQQLFLLGGKRKYNIELAKTNKQMASFEMAQFLADMRTELRQTFYSVYFDQKKIKKIDNQLTFLNDLLKAYKVQVNKGNISLKDQVRLQTIVINLNKDKIALSNNMAQEEQKLKLITGFSEDFNPEITPAEEKSLLARESLFTLEELYNKATEGNASYQSSLVNIESNKINYKLQKALNIPDITGGLGYSQSGGAFQNEINFSLGIPLPLWKQNAGNVQKAQYSIKQSEKQAEYTKQDLYRRLKSAYQVWQNQKDQYFKISEKDQSNLELVYRGMTENFRRGNVSLIEFTDFMDSYNQAILQILETKKQILNSSEELNHITQSQIF